MLPTTPIIKLIGSSYGKIIILPNMSQTNTKIAPNNEVSIIVPFILSPLNMDTIFGTIRPTYDTDPTTTIIAAVIIDVKLSPKTNIKL